MTTRLVTSVYIVTLMLFPSVLLAQEFEGTIKQRSIQVNLGMLQERVWNENAADEPDYTSEAEYYAARAQKLFDIPMERLESMAAEGEADITHTTIYLKGSRLRIAGEGGDESYMVYDLESGTFRLVNPQERTYLEYTRADLEEQKRKSEEMMAGFGVDMAEIDAESDTESHNGERFEALGRSEVINGFQTTAYEASANDRIGRGWCAADESELVQSFEALAAQAVSDEEEGSDLEDLLCEGQLPILLQVFDPYMDQYDITEIVAIDRTSVPDELFDIPAGYERISMEDMWR